MVLKHHKAAVVLPAMCFILLAAGIAAISLGQVEVSFFDTVKILAKHWGFTISGQNSLTSEQESVIYFIRLPRVIVAMLVGAALGLSGAVMQGVFGNPLADPGIIGVSSGAALGAVLAIALGLTANSLFAMPIFAIVGALFAVAVTVLLATKDGKIPVVVLLLSGVAVSMFMSALTSGILTVLNLYRVKEFLFWMVGGLDFRRWEHVYLAVGPITLGIILLCLASRHINILVLGENEAKAVGAPVKKLRLVLLFLSSLTTATAVCVSGNIGFVGLIVPHIMRLAVGPDHRVLLPASAIAGALFLVLCDLIARTIVPMTEIRVGIITALAGTPYFLYLLRQMQKGRAL